MKDNNYGKIEGILYGVPKLRVDIDNLKIDLEEVQEVMGIHGLSSNEPSGSPTYAFNSNVENEALDRMESLDIKKRKIEVAIAQKERKLKRIENNLTLLSEKELLLVELKYFKRYSVMMVCDLLELSLAGFNKRKKKIIVEKLMALDW